MKLFDIPVIMLKDVTKANINELMGQTFRVLPSGDKIKIGKRTIEIKVEGDLKVPYVRGELLLGNESFEDSARVSAVRKRIRDFNEDAFFVIKEGNKLGIILKDKIPKIQILKMRPGTHGIDDPPPDPSKEPKKAKKQKSKDKK